MKLPIRKAFTVLSLVVMLAMLLTPLTTPRIASATSDAEISDTVWQGDGKGDERRSRNNQNNALNFVNPGHERRVQVANENAAFFAIEQYAPEFGLTNARNQLRFLERRQTPAGSTVFIYEQVHNGVPVLGGEILVSTDRQGQLSALSGEVAIELENVNTTPEFSQSDARNTALTLVSQAERIDISSLQATTPQLYVYDPVLITPFAGRVGLSWVVEVRTTETLPVDYLVVLDAQRGTLRLAFNQIDTVFSEEAEQIRRMNGVVRDGNSRRNVTTGPDSPGGLPSVPNYNATVQTYNSNGTDDLAGAGSSTLVCTTNQPGPPNQLTGANSCDTTSGSPTQERNNAAHYFALDVFNYFDLYHDRNSLDDAGMTIISNVDYTPDGNPYNNAFWDGTQMVYGNGDFFTADDIVGHEMTHGVTQFERSLFYYYESGAINEAFSDIFGEFIDQLNGIDSLGDPDAPADRWLMGEDLGIGAIRDMEDPTSFGDPDRMTSSNYYAPTGENNGFLDSGGVHINSGVANKAAFLMVDGGSFNGYTITPLGATTTDSIVLAGAIWYEAYNYLTSGSDYGVLYGALNTACTALVGQPINGTAETLTASDCTEVEEVTLAVEMDQPPAGDATYAPQVDLTCPNGETPVMLFEDGFESGFGNFDTVTLQDNLGWGFDLFDDALIFYGEPYAWTGEGSFFGFDSFGASDHYATMANDVTLDGGVAYYLHFEHVWGFEDYTSPIFVASGVNDNNAYDGLVLEYTTDGGTTWQDAGPMFYDGQDYNAVLAAGSGNPLAGRDAWGYDSHGYVTSMFDLTALDGEDVNFRWRVATDDVSPKYFGLTAWDMGYWLDDVSIYSCDTPQVAPPGDGGEPQVVDPAISKIGELGPGELGLPGETLTWTITITNPTGGTLNNVVVTDTLRSELRIDDVTTTAGSVTVTGQTVTITIPSLAPGETVTVQIVTTVLSSPLEGTIDNTANMTADGGFSESASASVDVATGLPDTGYPPRN